jgi:hypothetical protein
METEKRKEIYKGLQLIVDETTNYQFGGRFVLGVMGLIIYNKLKRKEKKEKVDEPGSQMLSWLHKLKNYVFKPLLGGVSTWLITSDLFDKIAQTCVIPTSFHAILSQFMKDSSQKSNISGIIQKPYGGFGDKFEFTAKLE